LSKGQQELFPRPRSSITEKLPTWKPQAIPLIEEESQAYRNIIVEITFATQHIEKRPISLTEIYYGVYKEEERIINGKKQKVKTDRLVDGVKQRVKAIIDDKEWPYAQFVRSKRTVDRRVNEAASPDFYKDGMPKIVAVTHGIYQVNPALMERR
jgi:hypothetical protein